MDESLHRYFAELLSGNGWFDVHVAAKALAVAHGEVPGSDLSLEQITQAIPTTFARRNGLSRKSVGARVKAQLDPASVRRLSSLKHSSRSNLSSTDTTGLRSALFVATETELQAVFDVGSKWPGARLERMGRRHSIHIGGELVVDVFSTGQGNIASSTTASMAFSEGNYAFAVFCGVSGGLYLMEPRTVVIANNIHDYGSVEQSARVKSRSKSQFIHDSVQDVARTLSATTFGSIPIVVRPIASGEVLLTESQSPTREWIDLSASDAAVIETEGLGFMRAANRAGVPATVVRGISDWVDDKTGAADAQRQPIAARDAATVALALIGDYFEVQRKMGVLN